MADIAFPQNELKSYTRNRGFLNYVFVTAGAGVAPTSTGGDVGQVASCTCVGNIYTITFRRRFTSANVHATLMGGNAADSVVVTSATIGRGAPCVVTLTTTTAHVSAPLSGPAVQLSLLVFP